MTVKQLIKKLSELEHQDISIVVQGEDTFMNVTLDEIIHYGDCEDPQPSHHYVLAADDEYEEEPSYEEGSLMSILTGNY